MACTALDEVHVLGLLVLGCIIDGYCNPWLNALHGACNIHHVHMSSMHREFEPDIFLHIIHNCII